jgi:hypothetical protein
MMWSRTAGLLAAAAPMLLVAIGCGSSLTAPSATGATIAGTLNAGNAVQMPAPLASTARTAATASSGWTVTIAGTNLTATVDGAGNFQIGGIPGGDVQLVFSNGTVTATISLTNVGTQEFIQILVAISGSTATVVSETRTSSAKVILCHRTDNGAYHSIEVDGHAEPAHRAHGDGKVGDQVPADLTKVFSTSCRPVPPGVDIEKLTNGEDADAAPGPAIAVGSAVTWTYVVTNTGAQNLTNVSVVDDKGVVVNCGGKTTLAVGQSMTCTGTGVAVAGQYQNLGTVTATSSDGTFRDSDASHYVGVVPTSDDGPKVQLCHRTGSGRYNLIEVGLSAEPAHRAHGDAKPGEAVPGSAGKAFSSSCVVQ